MKKWIATLAGVGAAVAVGLMIRQVCEDLSDNVALWKSVTDDPDGVD